MRRRAVLVMDDNEDAGVILVKPVDLREVADLVDSLATGWSSMS